MLPEKVQHSISCCGSSYAVLSSKDADNKKVIRFPMRCRSWACKRCRRKKSRAFAAATLSHFSGCRHVTVLTLTMQKRAVIPETFKEISSSWNRLRTLLVKTFGAIKYVKVLEFHKSGMPHFHILCNRFIPQRWLSARAARAGFGRVCDIRHVDDRGGFFYVLKYLSKFNPNLPGVFQFYQANSRLVSGSFGFAVSNPNKGNWVLFLRHGDARYVDMMLDALKCAYEKLGYECRRTSAGEDTIIMWFVYSDPGTPIECFPETELVHQFALNSDWRPAPRSFAF